MTFVADYSDQDCSEVIGSQNTALLCGPTGVGKTATVYALAREMGFKVLLKFRGAPWNLVQRLASAKHT